MCFYEGGWESVITESLKTIMNCFFFCSVLGHSLPESESQNNLGKSLEWWSISAVKHTHTPFEIQRAFGSLTILCSNPLSYQNIWQMSNKEYNFIFFIDLMKEDAPYSAHIPIQSLCLGFWKNVNQALVPIRSLQ